MFSIFTKVSYATQAHVDYINSINPFVLLDGSYDPSTLSTQDRRCGTDQTHVVNAKDVLSFALHELSHLISIRLTLDGWADRAMQSDMGMNGTGPNPENTLEDVEQDVNAFIISYLFAKENDLLDQCCPLIIPDSEDDLLDRFPRIGAALACHSTQTPDEARDADYWRKHIEHVYSVLKDGSMTLLWSEACAELRGLREMVAAEAEEGVVLA